jgi:GxxExxY protein
MKTDFLKTKPLTENELATIIVNICFEIHTTIGPGCLESVYEEILCYELTQLGIEFERQKGVPVIWKDIKMDIGFRSDVIVMNKVIVDLKSVEKVAPVHSKILLTYLKLTGIKLGLLINFGEHLIKDGISRVVNKL